MVPVILSCFVAHQSLHPVLPLLVPYSPARMKGVLLLALLFAAGCFLTMSVGTGLAFGSDLDANVLNNLFVEGMEGLIGHSAAVTATLVVRGGYLLSLLGSVLLYMFPLRTCTAELVCRIAMTVSPSRSSSLVLAAAVPGAEAEALPAAEAAEVQAAATAPAAAAADKDMLASVRNGVEQSRKTGTEGELLLAGNAAAHSQQLEMRVEEGAAGARPLGAAATTEESEREGFQATTVDFEQRWFYSLTYGLLLSATAVAIGVPNIWTALSAIGDCATTVEAFIVPGVIALAIGKGKGLGGSTEVQESSRMYGSGHGRVGKRTGLGRSLYSGCAVMVIFLGVALFVNGVVMRILQL